MQRCQILLHHPVPAIVFRTRLCRSVLWSSPIPERVHQQEQDVLHSSFIIRACCLSTAAWNCRAEYFEENWNSNFDRMKEFTANILAKKNSKGQRRRSSKSSPLTPPLPKDVKLRRWVQAQRRLYKLHKEEGIETSLTEDRMKKFESLGYSLFPKKYKWDIRFQQVQEYVKKHGCFPHERSFSEMAESKDDLVLYTWCRYQHLQNKKKKTHYLTPARREKLNSIGFLRKHTDEIWHERYLELKGYQIRTGDCNIPQDYPLNQRLALWVGAQRNYYNKMKSGRPSNMTDYRLKKLEEIGFIWNIHEHKWMNMFTKLFNFCAMNGRGHAPSARYDNELRKWTLNQVRLYWAKKKGVQNSFSNERELKMRSLGFVH